MKKLLAVLAATTVLASPALAQDAIKEFNIGILGGENAQDRLASNECFRAKVEAALGVPVKIFTPADYDGVIQGLLGGTIDFAGLGASAYAKIYLTDPAAVDVKLTTQNVDGSTGYYSIGFARKDSGITNDANLYATETMNNPQYPLELLQRVITVSEETNKIVAGLPKLDI